MAKTSRPSASGRKRTKGSAKKPSAPRRAAKKPAASRGRIASRVLLVFMVMITLGFVGLAGLVWWAGAQVQTAAVTDTLSQKPGIQFLDRNGRRYGGRGSVYGDPITLQQLPRSVVAAVLATEDRNFFNHSGIHLPSIGRAMLANLMAGNVVQGGSTITQQLAKNLFLSHSRTYTRKIRELGLSLWLERTYTKQQILEMYLNRVYFGSNTWGIDGAANTYFGKSASELTLPEAAVLIGLLKAPSRLNPFSNPDKAADRGRQVLTNMVDAGVLSFDESKEAGLGLEKIAQTPPPLSGSRFFIDWVMAEARSLIGGLDRDLLIETTMDTFWQKAAGDALVKAIDANAQQHRLSQGALLSMTDTGAVIAMSGGYGYAFSQYNRATQAKRQPGSTFKIFVALAALRAGYTPETPVQDTPLTLKGWQPKNFDGKHKGTIPFGLAFRQSRNIPMVRVAQDVGMGNVLRAAKDLGVTSSIRRDLSSALGSSEVRMVEMVRAYAAVSNGGQVVEPHGVLRIRTREGRLLFERPHNTRVPYALNADEVSGLHYLLSSTMKSADGTGHNAAVPLVSGGKTGTSQESRDAWFIGYAGGVTTGIWLGNDDNTSMAGMTGGSLPARIWKDYVSTVLHLN